MSLTIRKNRMLQILFCLLLFTFLFPIILNVLTLSSPTRTTTISDQSIINNNVHNHQSKYDVGVPTSKNHHLSSESVIQSSSIDIENVSYFKLVTGDSLELQLAYRFSDLQNRVKYAEMIAGKRKQEIYHLLKEIENIWNTIEHNKSLQSNLNARNISMSTNSAEEMIQVPSLLNLMPHLSSSFTFNPAFRITSDPNKPSRRFVFGIPTVKRMVESYLIATLRDLIKNLSLIEQEQSIFVVLIAETDIEFVRKTAKDIMNNFEKEVHSGLIEIISPPLDYYPDFSQVKQTLGDPIERVRWRSKQNFDFAYLMMYCQSKGIYYVQLEDDIITKPSYLTKIQNFIAKNALTKRDWLLLDFCSLGFIGKLFRTIDLSSLVLYFIIFKNDKPVDWLLDHYIQTKVCRFDKDAKDCKKRKDTLWVVHKPSLFQHIGTHSSLKGKIQKLKDKGFGKMNLFERHLDNPSATIYTNMKHYKRYTLQNAYEGRNYFWAMSPIQGDMFGFKYNPAISLETCLIRTGNLEHPLDILYNATFMAKPSGNPSPNYQVDSDGFVELTHFDPIRGLIDVRIPRELNPIEELRVRIDHNSTNWMIISEIHVKELTDPTGTTSTILTSKS